MSDTQKQTAAEVLASYDGRPLRIMEVCGTHTHEIFRLGIRKLLPPQVDLISGPGCPVCVTPVGFIDEAIWLAEHGVTVTTFGDLVRPHGPTVPTFRWCIRPSTRSPMRRSIPLSRSPSSPWASRPRCLPPASPQSRPCRMG